MLHRVAAVGVGDAVDVTARTGIGVADLDEDIFRGQGENVKPSDIICPKPLRADHLMPDFPIVDPELRIFRFCVGAYIDFHDMLAVKLHRAAVAELSIHPFPGFPGGQAGYVIPLLYEL